MAKCGKSRQDSHACNNLHKVIKKHDVQLPVKVSTVSCWIRTSRRRVHQVLTNYPVLRIVDWIQTIFAYGGHFFLGGRSLDHLDAFRTELHTFWRNLKVIDPGCPLFDGPGALKEDEWERCIPIALHGDEGRGKAKNPIMIVGVQPILPLCGERTNMGGSLMD